MLIGPNDDIRKLAYAVIIQAAQDARGGDYDAGVWLQSDGLYWLGALGSDIEAPLIRKFIDKLKIAPWLKQAGNR